MGQLIVIKRVINMISLWVLETDAIKIVLVKEVQVIFWNVSIL